MMEGWGRVKMKMKKLEMEEPPSRLCSDRRRWKMKANLTYKWSFLT